VSQPTATFAACHPRRRCRRTGGIYVAVMASVLVVTLIGMSAVLSSRIERRTSAANDDAVRARFYARSFAEVVMQRLAVDDAWRSRYANNAWSPPETVDGARLCFRLIDDADSDLADDSSQPFRLQAKAVYGSATRSVSVSVQPPTAGSGGAAPPKIENGTMESYTASSQPPTRWYHYPTGPVETTASSPHGGARLARVYNRGDNTAGLSQDLPVTAIRKGATYDVSAWVKYATFGTVRAGLVLTDSTGTTTKFMVSKTILLSSWAQASGSVTPTWNGTLTSARFSIESANGATEIKADDVSLTEQRGSATLSIISGTVRRDLAD
jgi:hypothetical protein